MDKNILTLVMRCKKEGLDKLLHDFRDSHICDNDNLLSLLWWLFSLFKTKVARAYFYGDVAINQKSYFSTVCNYHCNETHQLFAYETSLEGLSVCMMLSQKVVNFC